jgi:hypothetical protein
MKWIQKVRLYRLPNIAKRVAVGLRERKKMIFKLLKKLKKAKMTDYDLGVLHASEGKEPTKETNLYKMGYQCHANLSSLQKNK